MAAGSASAGSSGAARLRASPTAERPPARGVRARPPPAASCVGFFLLRSRRFSRFSAFAGLLDGARRAAVRAMRARLRGGRRNQRGRTGEPLAELGQREGGNQVDGNHDRRGRGHQRAGQVQGIHQVVASSRPSVPPMRMAPPNSAQRQEGERRAQRPASAAPRRTP